MIKVEDFKNAPVGATATHANGSRAMKIDDACQYWITPRGGYLSNEEVALRDFALDPSAPTTAREALDLAWVLAHEVRPGQVVPKGTRYLQLRDNEPHTYTTICDIKLSDVYVQVRTLEPEPEPEPEPDWLYAPAVFARCGYCSYEDSGLPITLHGPVLNGQKWECAECQTATDWPNLRDVTPLYPKGQDA